MASTAVHRRVGSTVKPPARCGRNQAKPVKKCAVKSHGNGFLNHAFSPFWGCAGNPEKVAEAYFNSLANLCTYFGLQVPSSGLAFPQNIYYTWQQVEKQVRATSPDLHCMILQVEGKHAVLGVVKTFDLGQCLFYIPVRAYWLWLPCPAKQRIAGLVTVIFAYLHQVVGVPFYAESGTFMDDQYDVLEQWVSEVEDEGSTDEEEKAWHEQQLGTLYELRRAGGHMMPVIKDPAWLGKFQRVVLNFHHRNPMELEWEMLAINFLQLYGQYPRRALADGIHENLLYPDEPEPIRAGEYLSFYWSDHDCFQDELLEMINCSFQERPVTEEPTAVYWFDDLPAPEHKDFDFETRLFKLIERLRDLLNTSEHEEYHPGV